MSWPTVAWGLRNISSHELAEWIAEYRIEPFGEERADLREASHMALVANINRDQKKNRKGFDISDFKLVFNVEQKGPNNLLATVEMLNQRFGGKDLRKK